MAAAGQSRACSALARYILFAAKCQAHHRAGVHVPKSWKWKAFASNDQSLRKFGLLGSAAAALVYAGSTQVSCENVEKKAATFTLKDGRVIAYRITGSGIPVIAFHGMSSSSLTWEQGEKPFAGVQLIAIDRPGYGDSSPPPAAYSYSQFTEDVLQLADSLGLQKFCVAGHSSGGPYALAAIALKPDRVVACASISSDPPYAHPKLPVEVRNLDDFSQASKSSVDRRLEALGLTLQKPAKPVANYVGWRRSGNTVYISGQIPKDADSVHQGKVGADISIEKAIEAARVCGLNLIAQMKDACDGDLDRVKKILQVQGFVNSTADFVDHPKVVNGVSDLLCEVFGKDIGAHSRFAVGSSSLPLGVPVEVSAVIEVEDGQAGKMSSIGLYGKDPVALAEKWKKGATAENQLYAWKQGVGGWVCDFTLERIPWSFTLEEIINGPRVTFWVGEKDHPPIIEGAKFMNKLVPGSKFVVVADGDHGFKRHPEHLSAILTELCKQWREQ